MQELKQRAEQASPKDQIKLCVEIAESQLRTVDESYKAGDYDKARVALDDVANYGSRAAQGAISTRKEMKHTEKALNKIAFRLGEIARAVEFEERPRVKAVQEKLDKIHADLLNQMFAK